MKKFNVYFKEAGELGQFEVGAETYEAALELVAQADNVRPDGAVLAVEVAP